ncbi:MAG: non-canonical purine NTP pyrophosphatase [Candidatus Buchananbacteria bacterium]|nr:non-canonical purine NTP pyrophosphatase [Candidatus Buchananbacteria bacterium]
MKQLLLASRNPAKIELYKKILKDLDLQILALSDLNMNNEVDENGLTYEENSAKKALEFFKISGLPTLADDSGIEIAALNNEPGVKTRRWPGYEATDQELIDLAINKIKNIPKGQRQARFRVVISLCLGENQIYSSQFDLPGEITDFVSNKLVAGFPFRSVFWVPQFGKHHSDLNQEQLEQIDHRRKAMEKIREIIIQKI